MKRPNNRRNLDMAIHRIVENDEAFVRYRTTMANVIVAQMLPSGVVKGGASLKIRYGFVETRFTTDLDTARSEDLDTFINHLETSLSEGWEGFTGRIAPREPAQPERVPPAYIMQPFDIKLDYLGRAWCTVPLEVGHNEIGDANEIDWFISSDIIDMFTELGFPEPRPLPLMKLHYQIAQKLHGLSEEGSDRAHDLVDLQLIMENEAVDVREVVNSCRRLFAYRKQQSWPCTVTGNERWPELYSIASKGLPVIGNVNDAVVWVNDLIAKIDAVK